MKRMLIDVSSLCWTYLLQGKDPEFGRVVEHEGKKVQVNSATFGYEGAMDFLARVMRELDMVPHQMILVVEGAMSKSRRTAMYPAYKENRGSRPPEAYAAFNEMKVMLSQAFRNVGAQIVTQDGVEGDDIIAYLAGKLQSEKVIVTQDGDLAVLLANPLVSLYRNGRLTVENPIGPFDPRFITLYKALVGDSSDNIKGAHGFGEKAFLDLLVAYGDRGLAALEGMIKRNTLHELEDDAAGFKPFRKVIDCAPMVRKSYQVAQLHPEWVDTLRQPLVWQAGMVLGRDVVTDERLRPYAQQVRLITAENYDAAVTFLKERVASSPAVALDIETSTPDESDQWLADRDAMDKVDVLGSELTGLGLTFGRNGQYTYYFSVDHADTLNVTSEQVRQAVALIPPEIHTVIQNKSFELPILGMAWGARQQDNGWHGYLPNCIDTKVLSNYVDENQSSGLKQNSTRYLDYQQETYQEVTTLVGAPDTLPPGGRITNTVQDPLLDDNGKQVMGLDSDGVEFPRFFIREMTKQYKMRELSAQHVLSYGADDPICTLALYHHFRLITEIEGTWDLINEIEQYPAYMTAHSFTHGAKFSLQRMKELEAADAEKAAVAWSTVREFLIDQGWEGTVTPVYTELTPAGIKEMVTILLGMDLKTMVRKPEKLAALVAELDHEDAETLASLIKEGNLSIINSWVAQRFQGEPTFDVDSPKQMKHLLYTVLGLPVRLINNLTDLERKEKLQLAQACYKHSALVRRGLCVKPVSAEAHAEAHALWAKMDREDQRHNPLPLLAEDVEILKAKARTDDTAMDFALAFDVPGHAVLKAIQVMKTCNTRAKMYYRPYANIRHWKTNRIHAQMNQCATTTRRWSSSGPNLQQLPKRGEGVKFRECFLPHKADAVVVSVDFNGQEIRLQAGLSGDPGLISCYVGDNHRDFHSITASGAMRLVWTDEAVAHAFASLGPDLPESDYDIFVAILQGQDKVQAKLAKDLRLLSKGVNFGSAYGCEAPKMQELLVVPFPLASTLLETKLKTFGRFEEWKKESEELALERGYAVTQLGGRRHLREAVLADEEWKRRSACRQASNFEIQSAGAELIKRTLTRLWKSGMFFRLDAQFIAVVHDEVVFSVRRDHALEAIKIVHEAVSQPYTPTFPVPFVGSISLGSSFGEQHELGEVYDAEKIKAKLDELFKVQPEVATSAECV